MSSLQWQNVPIPFGRGLDTKNEQKNVQAPFLTDLQNGVFNKGGSIIKRNGYQALPTRVLGTDTPIKSGAALATFQQELLLFTDSRMYSYSPKVQAWLDKGRASSAIGALQPITSNAYSQTNADSAYLDTLGVFVWTDSRGGVRASVTDTTTNTTFIPDTLLASGATRPRVIASHQYAFVACQQGSNLLLFRLPFGNPTAFLPQQTLATDFNATNSALDLAFDGVNVLVAYTCTAPTTGFKVAYITPGGFLGAIGNGFYPPFNASAANLTCLNIDICQGNKATYVAVAYGSTTSARLLVLTPALANFASGGSGVLPSGNIWQADINCLPSDQAAPLASESLVLRCSFDMNASTPLTHRVVSGTVTVAAGSVTGPAATTIMRGMGLAAKSFTYAGVNYLPVAYGSPLQNTYFVIDDSGNVLSKHLPNQAGGQQTLAGQLPATCALSGTEFAWAGLQRQPLRVQGSVVYTLTGITEVLLDFGRLGRYQTAQIGQQMYVVGGVLLAYDGNVLVEDGFHVFPEGMTNVNATTGGGMSDGNYLYYFIYVWTDYQGQIHRSAPNPALAVALSGGTATQAVTWTIPTLRATLKQGVTIEVYRTLNNQQVAYQCSSITSPVLNDPSVDTVSFVDTLSDTAISSNQTLYSMGGVLQNDDPPQMLAIAASKNRLLGIPSETPSQVWYSKEYITGDAISWSLALTKPVPAQSATGTGGATALGFLDEKIIVFRNNGVLYFAGEGPDNTGASDNFTPMEVLNADSGCTNPNSIVLTSDGLLYQTNKGIRLVNRSLTVVDVGAGAYAYAADNQVNSAVSCQDSDQVRFTTLGSRALVYDTYWQVEGPDGRTVCGQWSTFTNHQAVGATIWNGTYGYLSPLGTVMMETPGSFTDAGNFYPLYIQTAWLPLAGPQGYMRVRRANVLGAYKSPHTILCQMAYDYRDFTCSETFDTTKGLSFSTWGSDALWGSGATWGTASDSVYQFRLNPSRQKCQAIQFSFQDLPNASNAAGQSYSLNNLSLEIGLKKGLFKLGTGKTGQVL